MVELGYLAAFLCCACFWWALVPQPAAYLQALSGPPSSYLPLLESARGPRRMPLSGVLTVVGKLLPRSPRRRDAARNHRMIYTGSRVGVEEFRGIEVLAALAGAFAGLVILRELGAVNPLWLLIPAALGLILPDLWLRSRIGGRQRAIVRLLPEIIDLLALCVGAGLDFLMALTKVVGLERFRREPLVQELGVALQEIRFGKRRAEALKNMAARVNLSEISSFVRTVVQADQMGTPIGQVLAVHSEDVRNERMVQAERMALKAPIKILFPLIFFIMPCVAIIVGAPIFIQFTRQSPFGR